jgi:beta-glucanase (GH16 family)
MNKNVIKLALMAIATTLSYSCAMKQTNKNEQKESWKLVWEEEFSQKDDVDSTYWSRIGRGKSDWNNYMSKVNELFEMRDGNLVLKGRVNDICPNDTAPYITGGVYTKGKINFNGCKISVRAKLQAAKGAWPAIWMLPDDDMPWPEGGEIDIMERLNGDRIAYQTTHSHYTQILGESENPKKGSIGEIDPDDYNVYSVIIDKDSLTYLINDKITLIYPKIETDKAGQFPFDRHRYYLLIDMQLGGSWVGDVDPNDLPVEMLVDWVKVYERK